VTLAASSCAAVIQRDGPIFLPSGPQGEKFGIAEGFPNSDPSLHGQPGEPLDAKYRVGTFSHFDETQRVGRVGRAVNPFCFSYAREPISYTYKGIKNTADDYVARHPVTGLLIVKDDTVVLECYQYGRTDRDRLFSGSMAKSITGLLIGIAIADGGIGSVDDLVQSYVPEWRDTEYGKTSIRDLLHMSSGVAFGEEANNSRDLDLLWEGMVLGRGGWLDWMFGRSGSAVGTIATIAQFNKRIAPPGTQFHYASIEPCVLGVVLRRATGKSLSDYLHEKVWAVIGTESDAAWLLDAQGFEVAHTFFGAVLRDYARLGRLFAFDGTWNGQQIIPAQWMIEATTTRDSDTYLLPGRGNPKAFGYGYLLWLLPGSRRQFVLLGGLGQRIFVDPSSKIVMVQTGIDRSLDTDGEVMLLWSAVVAKFGER